MRVNWLLTAQSITLNGHQGRDRRAQAGHQGRDRDRRTGHYWEQQLPNWV